MSLTDVLASLYTPLGADLSQHNFYPLVVSCRSFAYRRVVSLSAIASRPIDTLFAIADEIDKQCVHALHEEMNMPSGALPSRSHFMLEGSPFPGTDETHCGVNRYTFAESEFRILEYDSSQSSPELDDDWEYRDATARRRFSSDSNQQIDSVRLVSKLHDLEGR